MLRNIRFYISPFFASKYYLKKDILWCIKSFNFNGSIMDYGCGAKPYRSYFTSTEKYEGIDFDSYSENKDFIGSKPDYYFGEDFKVSFNLPFKSNSYDHSVAFQVMEHHPDPSAMIAEMIRVTKNNGYILLTIPFMGGVHEAPHDYQRLTIYGIRKLMTDFGIELVKIIPQGSTPSVISNLLNEHLNRYAARSKLSYAVSAIIFMPFLLASYLSIVLDKVFKNENIVLNYLVVGRVHKK